MLYLYSKIFILKCIFYIFKCIFDEFLELQVLCKSTSYVGDQGTIVGVDESAFGRRKYHEHRVEGPMGLWRSLTRKGSLFSCTCEET